jgi:hypothetical protein
MHIAALLAGCTRSQAPPVAAKCVGIGGDYKVTDVVTGGDCGPGFPPSTQTVASDGTFPPDGSCTPGPNNRGEGCSATIDLTCKDTQPDGTPFTSTVTGELSWTADGNHASGTITVTWNFGNRSCTGTYSRTLERPTQVMETPGSTRPPG